jgi:O-antigen ligase
VTERGAHSSPLAVALGLALTAGLVVAWSARSWRVAVAITSIALVAVLWAVTARTIRLPLQTIPVALIGAWGFLQLFLRASAVPHLTLRSGVIWAMSAIAFVLGSQIAQGRRSRRSFLNFMLWVSTGLAVLAMLQTYTSPGRELWLFPADDSVMGTFFYKNQFAAFMEIAAPIALWQIVRERVALGGICYAVIFAATLTSASRAGVTLVAAELIVFLALMVFQHRLPLKSAASVIAILVLLVAGASMVAGTEQTLTRFQDPNIYGVRRPLVDSTLRMIAERPWMGSGLGTWRAVYPRFATFDLAVIANEAHNDWGQWAAEGGIPFFLLVAILVVWLGKASVQSVWGLGVPVVLLHAYVDYPLREPALAFLWFAMAGALTQFGHGDSSAGAE